MANFRFVQSDSALKEYADFKVARIDGQKAQTLRQFFDQISRELRFPDYFEFDLESLDEALNDLEWLPADKIALYISRTDVFLSQEKSEARKAELLNVLDVAAEDWKWVDEEEGVAPREFVILFQPSDSLITLLDKEGFVYDDLA
ncbi:barstar (barnase inhibitor) [Larkinella arboricola]|uniref:Barstar (Barnase inhibitor) n=1 Tax=Larkinella arboricola TaxID=643671 RepID=A0A327X5S9_LARAB|nr:barstar family protein [Larkinella arboricola]RAJ98238.1 barstar (barnase inhibitor) [Larkinella arboricola]